MWPQVSKDMGPRLRHVGRGFAVGRSGARSIRFRTLCRIPGPRVPTWWPRLTSRFQGPHGFPQVCAPGGGYGLPKVRAWVVLRVQRGVTWRAGRPPCLPPARRSAPGRNRNGPEVSLKAHRPPSCLLLA